MKFIVTNIDDLVRIFNEEQFIAFAKEVHDENENESKAENYTLENCIHYVQVFCDELDLHCLDGDILPTDVANKIAERAEGIYTEQGFQAAINYLDTHKLPYGFCVPCDTETPMIKTSEICICGVCGSSVNPGVSDAHVEYTIKTTGTGTREEIIKALRSLADSIEAEYEIRTYKTTFENPTLCTEITIEN